MTYDLIGDIHGHADELRALLERLGYRLRNGCYSQDSHQVIFLGDFVDRGPKIEDTLNIVHTMVSRGAAQAVLGNHELNAILYHTADGSGGFLRSHTEGEGKNRKQHSATLEQLTAPSFSEKWEMYLNWFKSLPMFLELEGLRVVHAAWDPKAIRLVRGRSLGNEEFLRAVADKNTAVHRAVEMLLKGAEVSFPAGFKGAPDKEGTIRNDMRVAWWKPRESDRLYSFADLALPSQLETVPDGTIPPEELAKCPCYGSNEIPVFFGHYWLSDEKPNPMAPNAACLDYSVAKDGGRLAAYRWSGETRLRPDQFSYVLRGDVR